ncbi:hypothetical protein V6N11_062781 [Hibiscus sabdariffa]|uniref:Secreted protein n=1 Tax=Hibiscus sabdariffa TaxID=183260 RepID=A0ABR2PU54_9ROSI
MFVRYSSGCCPCCFVCISVWFIGLGFVGSISPAACAETDSSDTSTKSEFKSGQYRLEDWILANINQHGTCSRGEEVWPVRFTVFCCSGNELHGGVQERTTVAEQGV